MAITTIFLRQPTGIAIETEDFSDDEEVIDHLSAATRYVVVERRRDGAALIIPVANIASIEVR